MMYFPTKEHNIIAVNSEEMDVKELDLRIIPVLISLVPNN
jgi:hypothetical protein